jgi:hypothetical protein
VTGLRDSKSSATYIRWHKKDRIPQIFNFQ